MVTVRRQGCAWAVTEPQGMSWCCATGLQPPHMPRLCTTLSQASCTARARHCTALPTGASDCNSKCGHRPCLMWMALEALYLEGSADPVPRKTSWVCPSSRTPLGTCWDPGTGACRLGTCSPAGLPGGAAAATAVAPAAAACTGMRGGGCRAAEHCWAAACASAAEPVWGPPAPGLACCMAAGGFAVHLRSGPVGFDPACCCSWTAPTP